MEYINTSKLNSEGILYPKYFIADKYVKYEKDIRNLFTIPFSTEEALVSFLKDSKDPVLYRIAGLYVHSTGTDTDLRMNTLTQDSLSEKALLTIKFFKQSIEFGDKESLFLLGYFYGILSKEHDIYTIMSENYFIEAAMNGYSDAYGYLCLLYTKVIDECRKKLSDVLKLGVENGNTKCFIQLGLSYKYKDEEKMIYYLVEAMKKGDLEAIDLMKEYYTNKQSK